MTTSSGRGLYPHRLADGKTIVWYVRIRVGGRRRHYGSFPTVTEARHFRDRVKTEARTGRYFPGDASSLLTVEQLFADYLPTAIHRRAYKDQVRFGEWWGTRFRGRRVLSLTAKDLEDAKAELQRTRAAGTVRHYLVCLKHAMRVLVRPRSWVLDLWADVPLPIVTPPLPVIAARADEQRLYRELGRVDADRAKLGRWLGIRRGQLFGMRWERMLWSTWTYRLEQFKRQKERPLPIPTPARPIVRRLWIQQGRPRQGPVFPSPDPTRPGQPLDANAWYRRHFLPAAQRAGLHQRGLTFHSLRHTWATRGLEAGVHQRTLQAMGGWSDLKQVERYTHLLDKTLRQGMERAAQGKRQNMARSRPVSKRRKTA